MNEGSDKLAWQGDIQQIRTFSKSTQEGQQVRNETAQQILSARRRRSEITSLIRNLTLDAQNFEARHDAYFEQAQNCQAELDELSDQVSRAEASWINRLYQVFKSESKTVKIFRFLIGKSTSSQEYSRSEAERYLALVEETTRFIRNLEAEKAEIESTQEVLHSFYEEQAHAFDVYQEALRKRKIIDELTDIRRLADEHSVVFIHGITPFVDEAMMTRNEVIRWGTSWKSRLAIVLALHPDISCSTIRESDSTANMWSKMGVILSGGKIINSHPTDAATRVTDLHTQDSHYFQRSYFEMEPEEVDASIRQSISDRADDGYNELVVRHLEIAGFYVCLDADTTRNTFDSASHQELVEHLSSLGVPIYIIHNGRVYQSEQSYDQATQEVLLARTGDPLQPSELTQLSSKIEESVKERVGQQARDALRTND